MSIRIVSKLALVLLTLVVAPRIADAQTMSFSVYTDASANSSGVITAYFNVVDNSSGCSHTSYSTIANIVSPSGRTATQQSAGLQASTSLSINDEFGNYNVYTTGSYYCNCSHWTAGYGGGQQMEASTTTIEVRYAFTTSTDSPSEQVRYCTYAKCAGPSTCGTAFQDVIGIFQTCASGIVSTWQVKKFLGIAFSCEEIAHVHTMGNPCL